ncbi:hypothetical protein KAU11_03670 [Candidatus Babeliales bacterium]|nr:hypothetical protein [Candidatus Babeliales bacterium]
MEIVIDELLHIVKKLFDNLKKLGFENIAIDNVDYWTVCLDDLHDLSLKKISLGVGAFFDDWQELRKVIKRKQEISLCDVERLGNIIKIIGDIAYMPERFLKYKCSGSLKININDLFRLFKMILKKIKRMQRNH